MIGATLWLAASCRSSDPGPAPRPATGADDYAVARTKFHTKLTKQAPSPQRFDPQKLPADAREVAFDSGELHLTAWISQVPDGAPPRPAVLFLHGGFAFDLEDWQMAAPFRAAGFVVMAPILRGENGQAGHFSAFYDEVDDVLAAAEALAHQPGVDPGRLYVSGHSVGGTLTMLAAMASPRFRAAASLSGAPSQLAWIAGQRELATYNTADHDEIRMRSPILFATSFKCPTRLYWGDQEPFFTSATRQTAGLAKAAGLDVEAIQVPGNHMGMVTPAINLAIEFFQKHR
jgi:dipeptidyl aminopeptidase/acylaminoacyl peptidase